MRWRTYNCFSIMKCKTDYDEEDMHPHNCFSIMKCKTVYDEEEEDAPEMQYPPQKCISKAKFYVSFFLPDYSSNFLQQFQTAGYFCDCSILNTYLHNSNDALVAYIQLAPAGPFCSLRCAIVFFVCKICNMWRFCSICNAEISQV